MGKTVFEKIFENTSSNAFASKILKKLKRESILVTSIPEGGQRYFLNYVYERLQKEESPKVLSIYFEIIPKQTKIFHVASRIRELINHQLSSPESLSGLSCDLTIDSLSSQGYSIVIIINRFERLLESPESMAYLESLRANHPGKVHFLISCELDCIINPERYKSAGVLTSSNIFILPTYTENEIKRLIAIHNKINNWSISTSVSKKVYELSGGLCGLIKHTLKHINESGTKSIQASEIIQSDITLKKKLNFIVDLLNKSNLIVSGEVQKDQIRLLKELGATHEDGSIRIGLLAELLKNKKSINENNEIFKLLARQEYSIYRIFQSSENVISIDEISKQIWGRHITKKYSLWAIYKAISNINKKIKPFNLHIENLRGKGYQLTRNIDKPLT